MSGIVWLASYPKSGNTWLRVLLANLRADSPAAVNINQLDSWHFASREIWDVALGWETGELLPAECQALRLPVQRQIAAETPGRVVKTHDIFADPADGAPLFARDAMQGVIYVVRNPLDVAVSLSHHSRVSLDDAIAFMNDPRASVALSPGRQQLPQLLGDWSAHVASWVDAPDLPLCVLRYEDMLADPTAAFGRAAEVAGCPGQPERLERAIAHARFDVLQRQEARTGFIERGAGGRFFREGRSGGWRERLTEKQVARVVERHAAMMRRFGYLDISGAPAD